MQAELIIYRSGTAVHTAVVTPQASKEWKLMERDCITLVFNSDQSLVFQIGDYIDTEYGRYFITEEPLPAEYTNGVYRYTLRFDTEYMGWKNKLFQLTHNKEGVLTRKEAEWSLTDTMENHLKEFERNLSVLGFVTDESCNYAFCIDGQKVVRFVDGEFDDSLSLPSAYQFIGAAERNTMAYVQYNGASLISALKAITDAYHCEWWVKRIPHMIGISGASLILCFGKCQYGSAIDFKLSPLSGEDTSVINCDRITLNRNDNEYANRLYVFGSDKNIPDTYRKSLIFEASDYGFDDFTGEYGTFITPIVDYPILSDGTHAVGYSGIWMCTMELGNSNKLKAGDKIRYTGGVDARFACIAYDTQDNPNPETYTVLLAGAGANNNPTLKEEVEVTIPEDARFVIIQNMLAVDANGDPVVASASTDTPYGPIMAKRSLGKVFKDSHRALSRSMVVSQYDFKASQTSASGTFIPTTHRGNSSSNFSINIAEAGNYSLYFLFNQTLKSVGNIQYSGATVTVKIDGTTVYTYSPAEALSMSGNVIRIVESAEFSQNLSAGSHACTFSIEFGLYPTAPISSSVIDGTLEAKFKDNIATTLTFNGSDYPILIGERIDYYKGFMFVNSIPSGFGMGSNYTIAYVGSNNSGLSTYKVPSSYYTSDAGDVNDVFLTGERRLMLPVGTPYIDAGNLSESEKIVERMVIFDAIYPRCALRIVAIHEELGNIKVEEYADGSEKYEQTANYFIALKRVTSSGDQDFPFEEAMRIDGTELQVKFLTQDEEKTYTGGTARGDTTNGYQLSGLTFDVAVASFVDDQTGKRYKGFQIARNKDFGAMFPNLNRKPTIGDVVVLSGWNVKAMSELGLIDGPYGAEQELLDAGNAYVQTLEEGQFTFDCTMMSDWMQSRVNNDWIGQKANVYHDSLPSVKQSRVIGYRFKLDIPYDSPELTIGETDAYSRMKTLERKLEGETRNIAAGDTINATVIGSGGGGDLDLARMWASLTNSIPDTHATDIINIAHIPDDIRLCYVNPNEGVDVTVYEDEGVTGTVLWGAESQYQVALDVNGASKTLLKAAALDNPLTRIATLEGFFINGVANNANNLEGHGASYFGTAADVLALQTAISGLVTGVSSVAGKTGAVTLGISDIDGLQAALNTKLSTAVTSLGGKTGSVTLGSGLSINDSNVLSVTGQTQGTVTSVAMSVPTGLSVSGSPITSSGTLAVSLTSGYVIPTTAELNGYVNAASYNSTTKKIELKHGNTVVAQIDATDFIKDGMVSNVTITGGYLVISFNTDAGREDISIPLTSIFDPDNYYDKTASDRRFFQISNFNAANIVFTLDITPVNRATADASGNTITTTYATISGLNSVSDRVTTLEGRTNWDTYFGVDANGDVYVKQDGNNPRNFYSYGSVTAGGVGSGGGGGGSIDLDRVWQSLTNNTDKPDVKINIAHIPSLPWSQITTGKPTDLSGYGITDAHITNGVITLGQATITPLVSATKGSAVAGGAVSYSNGVLTVQFPTGQSIITAARDLDDADDLFFKASNDEGEEVIIDDPGTTGTVLWGAESANQVALSVNGTSKTLLKAAAIEGLTSSVGVLFGYFSGGSAYNALALEGHGSSYFATASALADLADIVEHLDTGVTSVVGQSGDVTVTQIATALTGAGYKLTDTIYTLPTATSGTLGGIKVGYSTSGKNYAIAVDGSGNAYVNVPWTDTTYSEATTSAAGLMSAADKTKLNGIATGATNVTESTVSGWGFTKNTGTVTSVKVGNTSYNPTSGVVSLPAYPTVPTAVSAFTNDAGYLTSVAFADLTSHPTTLGGYGITDAKIANGTITLGSNTITPVVTETDPTVPAWAKASSLAFASLPALYIGTTAVQNTSATQNLTGIGSITASGALTLSTTKKIYFGDTDHYLELDSNGFHFSHGVYSDIFITAGGVGSGGGGGSIDLDRVWESLTNNTDKPNVKINVAHIPDITTAKITDLASYNSFLNYYLKSEVYTKTEVGNLIAAIDQFHYEIYPSTSSVTDPQGNVLYLIGPTGSGSDKYEEYVYANNAWTKIGDTSIDLSPYLLASVAASTYQPLDADLTAIAGLTGTSGLLKKTAANTWTLDTNTYLTSVAFADLTSHPTTIGGYGITDAKIQNGVITLGSSTITPLTAHQTIYGLTLKNSEDTTVLTYNPATGSGSLKLTKALVGLGSVDDLAASGYFTLLENSSNQISITIGGTNKKLTVGYASNAGTLESHAASYFATATNLSSVSDRVSTLEGRTNWDTYFGIDSNGDVYVKKNGETPRNFYSYGAVTAGGVGTGGGGGGGVDIDRVWESLTNNTDKPNVKINIAHIPDITTSKVTDIESWIAAKGYVTSSGITSVSKGTAVSGGAVSTSGGAVTIQFPTIPTTLPASDVYAWAKNETLQASDVPSLTVSKISDIETWISGKNYLTGNQTITLSGDVSGSGTTAITVSIGAGKVTNAMLANKWVGIAGTNVNLGDSISATQLRSQLSISNVENVAINSWTGSTNITTLGTIATGVWNGTAIAANKLAIDFSWTLIGDSATYADDDYIHVN